MKYTNEELIIMSRAGDKFALEQLYTQCTGVIYTCIINIEIKHTKYGLYQMIERDDLIAMLNLTFMEAYKAYQLDKGCSFATFLNTYVVNRWRLFYRNSQLIKNKRHEDTLSTEEKREFILSILSDGLSPEEKILSDEALQTKNMVVSTIFKAMDEQLNPREQLILERIFRDKDKLYVIADDLGITFQRVSQIRNKALKTLHKVASTYIDRSDVYALI